MGQALVEAAGAQPKNPSRGKPIYAVPRFETGLFSNRNALHDPAQFIVSKFYGGYTDTLIDGLNMEISNKLTLIRRPGLSEWSSVTVPDAPNWFYNWHTLTCGPKVVVDTPTATYIQTATTQNQIFTKSPGAGEGYYVGVANTLYYGDGIDSQQFILGPDCNPANGHVFNFGIVPPLLPPQVTVTNSGIAVNWQANTVFSTMGLIVDSTGNIEQVISVNAQPVTDPNGTQFGMTGNGEPAWNQTPGGTTPDNGWNWSNWGPIVAWAPATTYNNASVGGTTANPCIIYDPTTKCCFINANPSLAQGTSGATKPNFPSAPGSSVHDGSVKWFNLGSLKTPQVWMPSHTYPTLGSVSNDDSISGIVEPVSLAGGLPTNQTIYWQVNETGSTQTSGTGGTAPAWNPVLGAGTGTQTTDGQILWLNLGSGTRVTTHQYFQWSSQGTVFSVIVDSNGNYQVCTTSGITSATATGSVPWATGYNQTTQDGTVVWTNVGHSMTWAANKLWYMPTAGWFPPSGSLQYGGSIVIDSNGNEQGAISSGESGATHPAWATTPVGAQTADPSSYGSLNWALIGPFTNTGYAITKSETFAYSYEARTATDIYNTTAPPDWPAPLGPPTGSESGQISTASPTTTIGPNPSATVTITVPGSPDPQVDTIVIWSTLDGGSTLFFLTEIPNRLPTQTVNITISPFTGQPGTGFGSVNELITAPINEQNNPPPAGFLPMAYHFERIWGAVGNFVFASGGPDVVTGNPNESFDPLDFFEFPSPVTAILPTATGILVFLTNSVYGILGGPLFSTFFPTPLVPGIGLLHYQALDVHGGVIYMFSADAQFLSFDPSAGAQRLGGPIADILQTFDPTKVYVTVHESGNDNAIFVADGSTGWFRLNPNQFPNNTAVWSPFAAITNGAKAVESIEVTTGVHRLLVGGTGPNEHILQRDLTTFQDDGTPFTCFASIGSFILAHPGQIAGLTFANVRATRVGTSPAVSFLLNEVSGTFTAFPESQAYPWQIYGAAGQPTSIYSNAYYFRSAAVPALAEHAQLKISFPAENVMNEVLTVSLFGTVEQSPEE